MVMPQEEQIKRMCHRIAGQNVPLPIERNENGEMNKSKISEHEDCDVLVEYFHKSPLMFLQKYKAFVQIGDIECFNDHQHDESIAFHIKDICLKSTRRGRTDSSNTKNRRYNAMQKLIEEGNYFNMVSLKKRYPKLYDQYIGRYLSAEEKEDMLKEELKSDTQATTLSSLLLRMVEKDMDKVCPSNNEDEEEKFDSSSSEEEEDEEMTVSEEEKGILREEFLSKVQSMFLAGEDPTFDYKSVDDNDLYDDFTLKERDSQDHYFDEEEASSLDKVGGDACDDEEDELDCYMKEINTQIST